MAKDIKHYKHKEIGHTLRVERVTEDTPIDTDYGRVLIERGHFIATPLGKDGKPNGKPYGIAKADLPIFYEETAKG